MSANRKNHGPLPEVPPQTQTAPAPRSNRKNHGPLPELPSVAETTREHRYGPRRDPALPPEAPPREQLGPRDPVNFTLRSPTIDEINARIDSMRTNQRWRMIPPWSNLRATPVTRTVRLPSETPNAPARPTPSPPSDVVRPSGTARTVHFADDAAPQQTDPSLIQRRSLQDLPMPPANRPSLTRGRHSEWKLNKSALKSADANETVDISLVTVTEHGLYTQDQKPGFLVTRRKKSIFDGKWYSDQQIVFLKNAAATKYVTPGAAKGAVDTDVELEGEVFNFANFSRDPTEFGPLFAVSNEVPICANKKMTQDQVISACKSGLTDARREVRLLTLNPNEPPTASQLGVATTALQNAFIAKSAKTIENHLSLADDLDPTSSDAMRLKDIQSSHQVKPPKGEFVCSKVEYVKSGKQGLEHHACFRVTETFKKANGELFEVQTRHEIKQHPLTRKLAYAASGGHLSFSEFDRITIGDTLPNVRANDIDRIATDILKTMKYDWADNCQTFAVDICDKLKGELKLNGHSYDVMRVEKGMEDLKKKTSAPEKVTQMMHSVKKFFQMT